jgi:glutamate-1-semialdehyde 2,1-aminomutase
MFTIICAWPMLVGRGEVGGGFAYAAGAMAKTTKTKAPPGRYAKSEKLFAEAQQVMPGGVSSPVRSFKAVGMGPVFIKEGKGARLTDVDNHAYVDYVLSYGPLILGHCPQPVRAAVAKQIDKGSSYGCCSEYEITLAKAIAEAMPHVPMVRFVNSGTEAAMSAIRLARGATTHGHPSSPGIPEGITHNTALVPFNDLDAAAKLFERVGDKIAVFALEPICGNIGVVPPLPGYLQGLRELCDKYGALLLFDEVMTGFRVALSGAQGLYGVRPDLTCLGKIIGGGLPVGAYGGRPELMNQVSPAGPVYQAGTLSGNPLSMAAGIATLSVLNDSAITEGGVSAYTLLENLAARLEEGLREAAAAAKVPVAIQRVGSMLTPFFLSKAQGAAVSAGESTAALSSGESVAGGGVQVIRNYADALQCDTQAYGRFFRAMLDRGIMLPPSQFEAWFLSTAHTEADVDQTIEAARAGFAAAGGEVAVGSAVAAT